MTSNFYNYSIYIGNNLIPKKLLNILDREPLWVYRNYHLCVGILGFLQLKEI